MFRSRYALGMLSIAVCFHSAVACVDHAAAEDRLEELSNAIVRGIPANDVLPTLAAILLQEESAEERLLAVICSGTLIAADVILTAAHCIENYGPERAPPGTQRAWFVSFHADLSGLGERTLELPEDAVKVRSTRVHPEFSAAENYRVGLGPSHDVGLVWLETALHDRKPSALMPREAARTLHVGAAVLIAGYGWRNAEGARWPSVDGPGLKAYGHSKVLEVGSHELRVGRPTSARSQDELSLADTCEGDSGGPMLLAWNDSLVIAGVTSRGYDRDERCDSAGVQLRLDVVRPWILEQLGVPDQTFNQGRAGCTILRSPGDEAPRNTLGWSLAMLVALLAVRGRRARCHQSQLRVFRE